MTKPTRTCGDCSACCYTHTIEELEKWNFRSCAHMKPGGGCSIYGQHPDSCQTFRCAWLNHDIEDDEHRPDKLGLVITGKRIKYSHNDPIILLLFEVRPGAFQEEKAQVLAHTLMGQGIALCVISPETEPRWQYHLYYLPENESLGNGLVERGYAVNWHRARTLQGHPSG